MLNISVSEVLEQAKETRAEILKHLDDTIAQMETCPTPAKNLILFQIEETLTKITEQVEYQKRQIQLAILDLDHIHQEAMRIADAEDFRQALDGPFSQYHKFLVESDQFLEQIELAHLQALNA